jgi:hypothetical protein
VGFERAYTTVRSADRGTSTSAAVREILVRMPLRDDREAARHRIDALERQLEEERERARRAEEEARAAKEALERAGERGPSAQPRLAASPSTTRLGSNAVSGPRNGYRRAAFERAVAIAVCVASAPVWVLHVGARYDLDDTDAHLLGWSLLPVALLLPTLYVLARRFGAPFPFSAVSVSLLASGVGWFALLAATTDMIWGQLLAEPPWRWVSRGVAGLVAIALHAVIAAKWCSEAVLSDPAPAGD